ncbi:MAG: replication-relaxation family protein, partial [Anaerolineales bacterium]|nr:replication-relaxation family protein [Anaerolineales bacterium]
MPEISNPRMINLGEENSLVNFLSNHPWTSKPVLEFVFGPKFEKLAKPKETRAVSVPGIGKCWGVKHEKLSSIPGVRRREQAKTYLLSSYGKYALWAGGSPGPWGSDLLAKVGEQRKFWIRVWVDNEGASVDALPFLHPVPARFAPNLADLIITGSIERAELIKRQLETYWKRGSKNALIYYGREDGYLRFGNDHSLSGSGAIGPVLKGEEVKKALASLRWNRLENIRRDQNVGNLFLNLSEVDFALLKYAGDNPLYSIDDLSMLVSSSVTGNYAYERLLKAKEKAKDRYLSLGEQGLLERAAPPMLGKKVTALGLEVLAKYWGVEQESMRRFHAWPQKRSRKTGLIYSERALTYIKDHTRLVQQFVFGLIDNAWRLQEEHGGADVYLETIIGKRIYFRDLATGRDSWVIPDAAIDLAFWRKTWRDGHVHDPKIVFSEARLLLEVDRATNPITRLTKRCQKYGRVWRSLSGNPVQIWVIDGTPWREKEILDMLDDAGINGWTVLIERLQLERGDPWWGRHSHKNGVLDYNKHGGFAPLRKIWGRAGDYELHYLLDHAPWEKK